MRRLTVPVSIAARPSAINPPQISADFHPLVIGRGETRRQPVECATNLIKSEHPGRVDRSDHPPLASPFHDQAFMAEQL